MAVIDDLPVEPGDYVVDKYGYGAFHRTNLVDILQAEKADTVVICHHGGRSRMVTNFLRQNGFAGALNLKGGILAWSESIDPSVPQY